jgi:hypothetical protein
MTAGRGVVYRDLGTEPEGTEPLTNNPPPSASVHHTPHARKIETANALDDGQTLSHQLATSPVTDTFGHAHAEHDNEVKDLGWNEPKDKIAAPLVGGMQNEDLWVLLRRFNKVW